MLAILGTRAIEELRALLEWTFERPSGRGDFRSGRSQSASPLLWKNTLFAEYFVMVFKGH